MKKCYLLFSLFLFLAACGGSPKGGAAVQQNGQSTQIPAGVETGTLVLNITDGTSKVVALGAGPGAPAATHVRIVVSHPTITIAGVPYKGITDWKLTDALPTISVPVGTGFRVDVVSYVKDSTTTKRLRRNGFTTGVTINKDAGTPVNITMQDLDPTIGFYQYNTSTPLGSIEASTSLTPNYYTVAATIPTYNEPALNNKWSLAVQTTDFTTMGGLFSTQAVKFDKTSPETLNPGTLYAQAEFFMSSSLLGPAENSWEWTYVYPNNTWGDAPVTATLNIPTGGSVTMTTGSNPW